MRLVFSVIFLVGLVLLSNFVSAGITGTVCVSNYVTKIDVVDNRFVAPEDGLSFVRIINNMEANFTIVSVESEGVDFTLEKWPAGLVSAGETFDIEGKLGQGVKSHNTRFQVTFLDNTGSEGNLVISCSGSLTSYLEERLAKDQINFAIALAIFLGGTILALYGFLQKKQKIKYCGAVIAILALLSLLIQIFIVST